MKQKTILRVVLIAVLTLVATTASAHDFEVDGIYYNKNGYGTVSVTYKGSCLGEYANVYTGDVVIPTSVTYSGTTYSVTSIDYAAFYGCSGLTSVTIPNSVTSIGGGAFEYCCGLTSVTIGNSVTSIGDKAFAYCSGLTSVTIGNSVTSIGNSAFQGCSSLTSVTIGNSVTSIGNFAFYGCSNSLESIVVESGNSKYDSRDNCNAIIETATNTLLAGCKNTTIPNSVTSIGNYAFEGCSGLTSVTIPNSVTSIGYWAFSGCSGLKSVTIPNSVTSIDGGAFRGCSGLTSVTIPNSVTSIGESAFCYCSSLASVTIGNSVTSIGDYAFDGCSSLTSITIPNSVTSIGDRAFNGCRGLTSVTIGNSVTSIGNYAFSYCSGLTSVTIGNSVTSIGNQAFYGCSCLTSVTIGNSVISIGNSAFQGCSSLTSVTIGNSVTSIGNQAFYGCSCLTSVTIGNSVTSIGDNAFEGCSGLKSVTIPNSVTSIGDEAFASCYGLETIFYNAENCADAGFNVFTTRNLNIIIGKDVKKVPNYLFYSLNLAPARVISQSVNPPTCGENTFNSNAYTAKLYVPSEAVFSYQFADVWFKFSSINGLDKPITGITLSESDVTLKVNETKTIIATITPADATIPDAYYWTSSNSGVATVDDNGKVSAVAEGTTVISAISYDGGDVVATCNVNVTVKSNKATSITLNATELKIAKNATATLTYTILPEDVEVKTAEWIVSDASVLIYRVKNDGSILIGGKSEGTATVTARTTDGSNLEATCVVSVGAGAVEGVDTAAARIYTANGNIIIAATEDGEATVYDFTGRLIKSVPVASGDSTAVPVAPGYYIVKTGTKTQSVVVK